MNAKSYRFTAAAVGVLLAAGASAEVIIPIAGAGAVSNGGNYDLQNGFNAQAGIVWNDITKAPSGGGGSGPGTFGGGVDGGFHYSFIDFGEDYAQWRITRVFTLYKGTWGGDTVSPTAVAEMWWTDLDADDYFYDYTADPNRATHAETELAMNTAATFNPWNGGAGMWHQDFASPGDPVTPDHRWLMVKMPDGGADGNLEYLFVGTTIPEPASLALLAVGAAAMVGRRRTRP